MSNTLLEKITQQVSNWRNSDYEGVFKETRNILRYINDVGYLYTPQKEALETYIYLKEVLNNQPTQNLITSLYPSYADVLDTLPISDSEKYSILRDSNSEERIKELLLTDNADFDYANQVYALTMGSGKTILMGTMILYEFVLATTYPDDSRFAKNVLVFAPDTTIIESLKEIKSFDYSRVLPKEYQNVLLNIKYHYLESTETAVNFLGNYNIIVSNSQKIILKTRRTQENGLRFLLNERDREKTYYANRRREAIRQLENLSVFVDEAHHSYGKDLEGDLKKTRETINYLHTSGQTPLVNVVNLTGTPYINNTLIPDVVYHYGLKQGIEQGILKQVRFFEYGNVKSDEFIENIVQEFLNTYSERLEGKLPKIAIYAASIDELQQELRPQLEKVLLEKEVPLDSVLEYHTEAEENKEEFKRLDTNDSNKQFILLVGKGTEGWNVRSLVATALYRKPKSTIFVLQSSTRCLRSIGDNSTVATIFLSNENAKILDDELKRNFDTSRAELERQESEKIELTLTVQKKKKLTVKKELRTIEGVQRKESSEISLPAIDLDTLTIPTSYVKRRSIVMHEDEKEAHYKQQSEETIDKPTRKLTRYELIARLNQRTHLSCLFINNILSNTSFENDLTNLTDEKLDYLIDILVQNITEQLYEYQEQVQVIEEEIELTKNFPFNLSRDANKQKLIVYRQDTEENRLGFHIDPYSFDTEDEKDLFMFLREALEPEEAITDVYFTGNVSDSTHTDFYFSYWNPRHQRIAKYFPDLLVETNTGRFIVIEVKSDAERTTYEANKQQYHESNELFDEVFAKEIGFSEFQKINENFDYHIVFNARLQQKQQELLQKLNNSLK